MQRVNPTCIWILVSAADLHSAHAATCSNCRPSDMQPVKQQNIILVDRPADRQRCQLEQRASLDSNHICQQSQLNAMHQHIMCLYDEQGHLLHGSAGNTSSKNCKVQAFAVRHSCCNLMHRTHSNTTTKHTCEGQVQAHHATPTVTKGARQTAMEQSQKCLAAVAAATCGSTPPLHLSQHTCK